MWKQGGQSGAPVDLAAGRRWQLGQGWWPHKVFALQGAPVTTPALGPEPGIPFSPPLPGAPSLLIRVVPTNCRNKNLQVSEAQHHVSIFLDHISVKCGLSSLHIIAPVDSCWSGERRQRKGRRWRRERRRGGGERDTGEHQRVFRPGSRLDHFHPHQTGQTQFMAPSNSKGGWDVESGRCPVGRGHNSLLSAP